MENKKSESEMVEPIWFYQIQDKIKQLEREEKHGGKEKMEKKQKQELSETKVEQLNKQPIIETSVSISEDKKWIVHKTTITDIKPTSYMEKVLARV